MTTRDRDPNVPDRSVTAEGRPSWEPWLLLAMVTTGMLIRLREFLFAPALGHDEAALANNIVDYSMVRLLTEPLDSGQVAPIGVIAVSEVLGLLLGTGEMVLRLPAFVGALGAVVMALLIAQRVFTTPIARFTFVAFVSFADVLIYYGNEAKQYGVDVFAALLLLWISLSYQRWRKGLLWLSLAGAVVVWFSHAAVFVAVGIGFALGWRWMQERRWSALGTVGLAWGGSTALMLLSTARSESTLDLMQAYWDFAFAPFPPVSPAELLWYPATAAHLVSFAWRESFVLSDYRATRLALLGLALAGCIALIRTRGASAFLFLAPPAILLTASALRLYPFRGRLALFLVPIVFLLSAFVVDLISSRGPPRLRPLGPTVGLLLVASLIVPIMSDLVEPQRTSGIRGSLEYLAHRWRPDDTLTINEESIFAYRYYANRQSVGPIDALLSISHPLDVECFLARDLPVANRGRAWFLFSHRMDSVPQFVAELSTHAPLIDASENTQSAIYLFDLSSIEDDARFDCLSS